MEDIIKIKSENIYLTALKYEKDEIGSIECYREIYLNLLYRYYQNNNINGIEKYAQKNIDLMLETATEYPLDNNHYSIINIILETLIKNKKNTYANKIYKQIEDKLVNDISDENILFKAVILDKKYELSSNQNDRNNISKECIKILNENTKLFKKLHENTIEYMKRIEKKHTQLLLNDSIHNKMTMKKFFPSLLEFNEVESLHTTSSSQLVSPLISKKKKPIPLKKPTQKSPCYCGSGKKYKHCCGKLN